MTNKAKLRVGDELKLRREELGYTLHKVEVATKIRGKYLRAIEASDFNNLPNDVYSRGFVRQYAQYLKLPASDIIKRYQLERGGRPVTAQQAKPRAMNLRAGATSRWVISLAILGALAVVIGYLLWQFSSLTAAPELTLRTPSKDGVVTTSSIEVAGQTAAGADVFLNDVPLPSDVNGSFKTTLILQPGVNEVRVVSKNKLGKETRIVRNILSRADAAQKLPITAFDGVAVELKASDASGVKIVADDKIIYEGSLAKGSSRLITAKDKVVISSGKPEVVLIGFTNNVLANYNLGKLGFSPGATIEITKTTNSLK